MPTRILVWLLPGTSFSLLLKTPLGGGGRCIGRFRRFDPATQHPSDFIDDLLYLRVFLQIDGLRVFGKTHEYAQQIELHTCLFQRHTFRLLAPLSGKAQ